MESFDLDDFDFYISSNGRLIIPKFDIDYLVSISESTIPSMPEASETSSKIAGRDGDIVLATTYEPISFVLVCYTNDNLTINEKVAEERKINNFLNSIKNTTKKFVDQKNEKFYNVKYNGALSTVNYPTFLQFSIPLKSSDSFGYSLEKKKIVGNGKENSNTIKDAGAIFTINGPAITPIISFNDYSMEFGTDILSGARIVIDTSKSTVTHINNEEVKANAMKYYNHQFPKVENGINELKVLSGIDDDTQVSVEWYDLML